GEPPQHRNPGDDGDQDQTDTDGRPQTPDVGQPDHEVAGHQHGEDLSTPAPQLRTDGVAGEPGTEQLVEHLHARPVSVTWPSSPSHYRFPFWLFCSLMTVDVLSPTDLACSPHEVAPK